MKEITIQIPETEEELKAGVIEWTSSLEGINEMLDAIKSILDFFKNRIAIGEIISVKISGIDYKLRGNVKNIALVHPEDLVSFRECKWNVRLRNAEYISTFLNHLKNPGTIQDITLAIDKHLDLKFNL